MTSQGVRNDLAIEQQTCLWHVNMESHNRYIYSIYVTGCYSRYML